MQQRYRWLALVVVLLACTGQPAPSTVTPTATATVEVASATAAVTPQRPSSSTPTRVSTPTASTATQCGVERWPVKVLSDDDAGRVNRTPTTASVAELVRLPAPATLPHRTDDLHANGHAR